jgi:hypothetical protein
MDCIRSTWFHCEEGYARTGGIGEMMKSFRANHQLINGSEVVELLDYENENI